MSKTSDTSKPVEAFTHDLGGIGYKTAASEGWGNVVSPEPGGIGYKTAAAEGFGNVVSPEPSIWIYDLGP